MFSASRRNIYSRSLNVDYYNTVTIAPIAPKMVYLIVFVHNFLNRFTGRITAVCINEDTWTLTVNDEESKIFVNNDGEIF